MHRYNLRTNRSMDCGSSFIKYLLFIFNFIFWIFSIAVLSLGVIYKLQIDFAIKYLGSDFPVAPDLFIAVGTIAFVVSFFGCYGAWKENRCALLTFVSLLIILLIIEIGVVVIAFIGINNADLENQMKKQMYNEVCSGELANIEKSYECCGVLGPSDYYNTVQNCENKSPPSSCYKGGDASNKSNLYKAGCFEKLKDSLYTIGVNFGAIGITVALMQIIGVISAIMLSGVIKRNPF